MLIGEAVIWGIGSDLAGLAGINSGIVSRRGSPWSDAQRRICLFGILQAAFNFDVLIIG
jgi:hypothetical protein